MDNNKNGQKANRLVKAKSPYLLQHAYNPVDWHPWGEEAFNKAKKEDKPIFLSIGYSTCHWCHVMARESFEDMQVADILNQHYVAIKVDREERPDIDNIYMTVCQALTGQGGWPLTVFLTPEKKPFFAGTYFPKHNKGGMTGLIPILKQVNNLWQEERTRLQEVGEKIIDALLQKRQEEDAPQEDLLQKNLEGFKKMYDREYGGFGSAPKFPTPSAFLFLLRWWYHTGDTAALEMVTHTLAALRRGGIYDQLGFGFHRYAVDRQWLVPHFEKMLYDQALLATLYGNAFLITKDPLFQQTLEEIITYVNRDLKSPEGAFYTAENAESEGEEGKYFVWTSEEIDKALAEDSARLFKEYYGVTPGGNFENGNSILFQKYTLEEFAHKKGMKPEKLQDILKSCRQELLRLRGQRERPSRDEKILTSWNGLMITGLVRASRALGEKQYTEQAKKCADFFLNTMQEKSGLLYRSYFQGSRTSLGILDDYAFLAAGLLDLYEATYDAHYLKNALALTEKMLELFWDKKESAFFLSPAGAEKLPFRPKEAQDGALPSGNAVAALNLLRLGHMLRSDHLIKKAQEVLSFFGGSLSNHGISSASLLTALLFNQSPVDDIIITGLSKDPLWEEMTQVLQQNFLPHKTVLFRPLDDDQQNREILASMFPDIESYKPLNNKPTAFVCRRFTCQEPVIEPGKLANMLLASSRQ